jgi:hypothetical protein
MEDLCTLAVFVGPVTTGESGPLKAENQKKSEIHTNA